MPGSHVDDRTDACGPEVRDDLAHALGVVEVDTGVPSRAAPVPAVDRDERHAEHGYGIAERIGHALIVVTDEDEPVEVAPAHIVHSAGAVGLHREATVDTPRRVARARVLRQWRR